MDRDELSPPLEEENLPLPPPLKEEDLPDSLNSQEFEVLKFLYDAQDRWLSHKLNCIYDIARTTLTLLGIAAGWAFSTDKKLYPPNAGPLVTIVIVLIAAYGCGSIIVNNDDYAKKSRTARALLRRIKWAAKDKATGTTRELNADMIGWLGYDESRSESRAVGHCGAIILLAALTLFGFWSKL
jgi:hypothetical protein